MTTKSLTPKEERCKECHHKLRAPAKPTTIKVKTKGVICPIGIFGEQPCAICGRLTETQYTFDHRASVSIPDAFLCCANHADQYGTVPEIQEPLKEAFPELYARPEMWKYFEHALTAINNTILEMNRLYKSSKDWSDTYHTQYKAHAKALEDHRAFLVGEFIKYKHSIGHGLVKEEMC